MRPWSSAAVRRRELQERQRRFASSSAVRDANIALKIEDIGRRMVSNIPDVLTDLLEVATYVYCADQLIARGGNAMQALGTDWRRKLRFIVPVREPDRWGLPGVTESLVRLLSFMSDDEYEFRFERAPSPASGSNYFDFADEPETVFKADEVVMFSGGLDSLAGAAARLAHTKARLLLVSHQSSPKMAERQKYLAAELLRRFPRRVFHVPVRITKRNEKAVETTQRSRSFLFVALATAAGYLAKQLRLRFYENGVISFNLPIATQVVGARATRSTHPRVMHELETFMSALLEDTIELQNPYIWKTKCEVASALAEAGHVDLLRYTVSCSHVHGMTKLKTHCGRCSQCLDRRFATLAAGLGEKDPEEMYEVDLLTGPRDAGDDRTMAESFVRHAREFLRLTEIGFVGRFGGHVARAATGFPDLTADQVMQNAISLHQRHGQAVLSGLEAGFRIHARALAEGSLPETCLLRIVGNEGDGLPGAAIRDPMETDISGRAVHDECDFLGTSEIRLALNREARQVVIGGIGPIKGPASFDLAALLVEAYEEDRSRGRAPENYRYVGSSQLTRKLSLSDFGLRRRVERFRKTVANSYERCLGLPISADAVIQTRRWQGYRMNPMIRVVAPDQVGSP